MSAFNPLEHRACLTSPRLPRTESGTQEHIPFLMLMVELLRPDLIVELGVHTGVSYLAFCEAVVALGLPTRCFGVDSFKGDEHSGTYGMEVLTGLRAEHDPLYGGFSRLVPALFDEAAGQFIDGTVDLLHIDGLHTCEAVRHDYEHWRPKLSPRAVVLFHDTNVRERGFGVWRLWEELADKHPHLAFAHGNGLGVLAPGEEPPTLGGLLSLDANGIERVNALFFLLGNRITFQLETARLARETRSIVATCDGETAKRDSEIAGLRVQLKAAHDEISNRELALESLQHKVAESNRLLQQMQDSMSFRLGRKVTALLRWLANQVPSPRVIQRPD